MLVIEMLMEYYETNYEFDKIVISPDRKPNSMLLGNLPKDTATT